jgi:AraC-like DNA-binding protein
MSFKRNFMESRSRFMIIKHYRPAGLLKKYIESYSFVKTGYDVQKAILPDISIVLSIRLSGKHQYAINDTQFDLPPVAVTGIRKSSKSIQLSQGTETLLVRFKAAGAGSFFKNPIHEFYESGLSLDDIYSSNTVDTFFQQIASAEGDQKRIETLEMFLNSRLTRPHDLLVETAVAQMHLTQGKLKIKQLCVNLNVSIDAFEKRFRKTAGASPKRFCSIVRMRHAIDMMSGQTYRLPDLIHQLGYFDQTHFIKDFRLFTGLTPSVYLKSLYDKRKNIVNQT